MPPTSYEACRRSEDGPRAGSPRRDLKAVTESPHYARCGGEEGESRHAACRAALLADKVHPLALGNVKRHTAQSQMMGAKLLKSRTAEMSEHDAEEIIRKLTSELFFHGHPINRLEARESLGLDFVHDATPAVRDAMWELYQLYVAENRLDEAFMPIQEAIAMQPLAVPTAPAGAPAGMPLAPSVTTVDLDVVRAVTVDSVARSDVYSSEFSVTLQRDAGGTYNGNIGVMSQKWSEEV